MRFTSKPTIVGLIFSPFVIIMFSTLTISCHKTLGVQGADSTVFTLQPGLNNGFNESIYNVIPYSENPESTYVSPAPGENFNGDSILTASNYEFEGGAGANILLRFDGLSTIPATDSIISATLYLYGVDSGMATNNAVLGTAAGNVVDVQPDNDNGGVPPILLEKITGSWDGSKVTYNTRPPLTSTGAVTIPAPATKWNYNVAVDITPVVKFWVANPSSNFGCSLGFVPPQLLSQTLSYVFPGPLQQIQFYSGYAANNAVWPRLVVVHK